MKFLVSKQFDLIILSLGALANLAVWIWLLLKATS